MTLTLMQLHFINAVVAKWRNNKRTILKKIVPFAPVTLVMPKFSYSEK